MTSLSNENSNIQQAVQKNEKGEVLADDSHPKYPSYGPVLLRTLKRPALEPHDHKEHAKDADPGFKYLLQDGGKISHLTPRAGSELSNIQLSDLSRKGKDDLALLVAERKVVLLRDQDMRDLPMPKIMEFCEYFGKPSTHPVGPTTAMYSEIHIAYSGGGYAHLGGPEEGRTTSMAWHIDGSVELQPPGLVFLYMLECPATGGDTVFTDMVTAYEKLSSRFQQRLHGLESEHSDVALVEKTLKNGGSACRDGISNVHPIVRTHPATGEKALFVNPIYTTRIMGYNKEESDTLLNFLYNHIVSSQDCQVRVRWSEGAVVVFDNRVVCHSVIRDIFDQKRRHLARISLAAERPYETPFKGWFEPYAPVSVGDSDSDAAKDADT